MKGLSTGAKAGIAAGVVVIVVALAVGLFFFLKRRNKTGRTRTDTFDAGPSESELSGRVNVEDEQQKGLIPQTRPIRYPDPDDTSELAGGRINTGY